MVHELVRTSRLASQPAFAASLCSPRPELVEHPISASRTRCARPLPTRRDRIAALQRSPGTASRRMVLDRPVPDIGRKPGIKRRRRTTAEFNGGAGLAEPVDGARCPVEFPIFGRRRRRAGVREDEVRREAPVVILSNGFGRAASGRTRKRRQDNAQRNTFTVVGVAADFVFNKRSCRRGRIQTAISCAPALNATAAESWRRGFNISRR